MLDGPQNPGPGQGGPRLGSTLTVTGLAAAPLGRPGAPAGDRTLTIVGFANSITNTADGWVTPGEITPLQTLGAPASAQMMYRFARAGSYPQIRADVAEITRRCRRVRSPAPPPGWPRRARRPATAPSWSRSWSRSR